MILNHWICIATSHRYKIKIQKRKGDVRMSSIYYNHLIILERTYAYYDQWTNTRRKLAFFFLSLIFRGLFASSIECDSGWLCVVIWNRDFIMSALMRIENGKISPLSSLGLLLTKVIHKSISKIGFSFTFFIFFRLWLRLFIIIGFPPLFCVAFFFTFHWMKAAGIYSISSKSQCMCVLGQNRIFIMIIVMTSSFTLLFKFNFKSITK